MVSRPAGKSERCRNPGRMRTAWGCSKRGSPLLGVSIRVGLGRGRNRNLPLPSVVSLWFFLFGQAKRKNIRPSPAFAGGIRKRRSCRAGDRKGEAKRRAPLRHDLKGEAKRKAPLSPLRGTSPQRGETRANQGVGPYKRNSAHAYLNVQALYESQMRCAALAAFLPRACDPQ